MNRFAPRLYVIIRVISRTERRLRNYTKKVKSRNGGDAVSYLARTTRVGLMDTNMPPMSGAAIPPLYMCVSSVKEHLEITYTLDSADAVPQAVPRTSVINNSGVILDGIVRSEGQ